MEAVKRIDPSEEKKLALFWRVFRVMRGCWRVLSSILLCKVLRLHRWTIREEGLGLYCDRCLYIRPYESLEGEQKEFAEEIKRM